MKITAKQYAIALYESTRNIRGSELEKRIENFIGILKKNNDLSFGNKIIESYHNYYREKKGISKIEIKSQKKLDSAIINKIIQKFNKQTEIVEKIDKSLIGGVVVTINDSLLIDATVKRKLDNLKNNLIKS